MPAIRNVILDWSGTLVDDFGPVLEATNEIFRHYGKEAWSADKFREKFYLPFPKFYEEHLPEFVLAELDDQYHSSFKILQNGIALLPHAQEFLDYLRERGLPTFLLSSIHRDHFEAQGGRLKVKQYFRKAYVQALDKRQTILELMAEHDLDASETLFIGDMVHDIETARHAGVMSCAVLTGYDSLAKLKQASPDLLFRNLAEVRSFLERHRGVETHPPLATVGALIYNERGKVLMIQTHKWSHRWGIPGGKIKTNETSVDALRREVREETGLELRDIRFVLVQDCIEPSEFYRKAHFILLNYVATAVGTEVVLNDEAETFRWVSPEEAAALDLNSPTRILLEHADLIRIVNLEVTSVVGVSDEERLLPQKLLFSVELRIRDIGPAAYTDNVKLTVDYAAVAERVHIMTESRPRRLLETLAEDIATDLLKAFPIVMSLRLELKKFILADADHVGLIIERPMEGRPAMSYRHSPTTSLRIGPNTIPGR